MRKKLRKKADNALAAETKDRNVFFGRKDLFKTTVLLFCYSTILLLFSCSASKITQTRQWEPVQLSEEQQLSYDNDFLEATKQKIFSNLPAAASILTRCTDINPFDAAAHYQLSEIYSMIDDKNNALRYARKAAKYAPDNEWYKLQLVNIYITKKDLDSAIIVYRQIIDAQPYNSELRYNMVLLLLENKDFRKADKELNKIEKIYGFTEEHVIAKYRLYTKKGDMKATESLLKRSIKEFPNELRFYGLLAELYSMIGREKEAHDNYVKLLEVEPENALGYFSMIEFYKDYGRDDKALEEMQRMYQMKTIDTDTKIELYLQLSEDSVFFKKYYTQMDELVKELFENDPDNFRLRILNTDRNMRKKNYEAAKDDLLFLTNRVQTNYLLWEHLFHLLYLLQENETLYETTAKALLYFEDSYLFNFFRGFSASMLKKYDEAISAFFNTIEYMKKENTPDRDVELQTYVFLGEACNEQKRFEESDLAFEKAIQMSPNNTIILNNYSYYLSLREEKLELAETLIKRCIAQEPNSSTFLDSYAWVLYKLGRINEAIAQIEKAIKNGGNDNPEIIEHYCELLTAAGRTDEAFHICNNSVEMNNPKE